MSIGLNWSRSGSLRVCWNALNTLHMLEMTSVVPWKPCHKLGKVPMCSVRRSMGSHGNGKTVREGGRVDVRWFMSSSALWRP